MNREERRAAVKKLTKKGLTKESAITFVKKMNAITTNPITAWEGEKVTLDYNRIISYPDWKQMREDYRNWVTEHKNDIFTVEFDPLKKERQTADYNSLVQFAEDETNPKWLFWAGDLIPVEGQTRPDTDKEKLVKEFNEKVDNILAKMK